MKPKGFCSWAESCRFIQEIGGADILVCLPSAAQTGMSALPYFLHTSGSREDAEGFFAGLSLAVENPDLLARHPTEQHSLRLRPARQVFGQVYICTSCACLSCQEPKVRTSTGQTVMQIPHWMQLM